MEETDEAVPHATELSASSTELICSFDFYKLLFRSSPPFSINIKASYNYQKTFIIVVRVTLPFGVQFMLSGFVR